MALGDSWHRALVYFGLAEDRDPYEEDAPAAVATRSRGRDSEDRAYEPEAEIERPKVSRLTGARRRRDEIDDIFADDEPSGGRPTTVLRSVGRPAPSNGRSGGDVRVHLVIPKSFNDAQQVADKFKDSVPVVLNLQSTDSELNKRLIDFASGLTYALDGGMQRLADKVFMLTPRNVKISAEERASLIEQGFFNQS